MLGRHAVVDRQHAGAGRASQVGAGGAVGLEPAEEVAATVEVDDGALGVGRIQPLGGAELVLGSRGHRLVFDVGRRRRVAPGHLVDHVARLVHVQLAASLSFELVTQDEVGDEGLDAHARSVRYCLRLKRRVLSR